MAGRFSFFRRGGNKTATNKTKHVDAPKSSGGKDVDAPKSSGGGKKKTGGFGGGAAGNIMNIALLSSMFIPFENLFGGGGNGNSTAMSPEDLERQEQLIQKAVPLISCCCCSLSSFLSLVLVAILLMGSSS